MSILTITKMNVDICNALGLDPKRVMCLQINLAPYSLVVVTATLKVDPEQMEAAGGIIRRYMLVPMDDAQEVTTLGSGAKEFRATN